MALKDLSVPCSTKSGLFMVNFQNEIILLLAEMKLDLLTVQLRTRNEQLSYNLLCKL